MGTEISWETRQRAEDLYVFDGLTYEQVAEETGVSLAQLKRWGKEGDWSEHKRLRRQQLSDIKRKKIELAEKLISKALTSTDPQDVYAFARVARVVGLDGRDNRAETKTADIDRPKIFLENLEFIASVLKEVDPAGLKVLSQSFEIIVRRFKRSHAKTA